MNSHADELTALCDDAGRVIGLDDPALIDAVIAGMSDALGRGVKGDLEEMTRALDATTALVSRVEEIRDDLAGRLRRIRAGRQALDGYKLRLVRSPKAVDVSG